MSVDLDLKQRKNRWFLTKKTSGDEASQAWNDLIGGTPGW